MLGKRVVLLWIVVAMMLGAALAVVAMTLAQQTRPAPIVIEPPPPTATPVPSATPSPLRVYVSGEVQRAAVYELPPGSIVADAIEAAGSFGPDAAVELINLARPLADGMHVYVPANDEVSQGQPLLFDVGEPAAEEGEPDNAPVNINTAGLEALDTLPGVGPAIAQSIIDHRQQNGPFTTIEDIMNVSGIGPAKFEQMKEMIAVE